MSYSLVFTREAIPYDDQEALSWVRTQLETYYVDSRPPHPQLKSLHDALTGKYPCLCDLPDDQIDEAVWCCGPLIDDFSHDIAVVFVAFTRLEDVMPFIVETALDMGCAVFDLQGKMVYRPDLMLEAVEDIAV
jgi:hypothetical protein